MIQKLLYFVLMVLLAPALWAFVYEGALYLTAVFTFEITKWFLLGIALSLLAYVLFLHNNIGFIEHLLHEFEHATLAFVFTRKLPKRMEIDPEKGSKVVGEAGGGCLRALAPYWLPLLTIPFLLFKGLAALTFSLLEVPFPVFLAIAFDLLIGATLIFHIVCSIKEYGYFQTDIKKIGLITSTIIVLFLNFMILVICLMVVTGAYTEFWEYIKAAAVAAVDNYRVVIDWSVTHLPTLLESLYQTLKDLICPQCP